MESAGKHNCCFEFFLSHHRLNQELPIDLCISNRALGSYFWIHQPPWAQRSFLGFSGLGGDAFSPLVKRQTIWTCRNEPSVQACGEVFGCLHTRSFLLELCLARPVQPDVVVISRMLRENGRFPVFVFCRFVSSLWFLFICFCLWSRS